LDLIEVRGSIGIVGIILGSVFGLLS